MWVLKNYAYNLVGVWVATKTVLMLHYYYIHSNRCLYQNRHFSDCRDYGSTQNMLVLGSNPLSTTRLSQLTSCHRLSLSLFWLQQRRPIMGSTWPPTGPTSWSTHLCPIPGPRASAGPSSALWLGLADPRTRRGPWSSKSFPGTPLSSGSRISTPAPPGPCLSPSSVGVTDCNYVRTLEYCGILSLRSITL